MIHGRFSRSVDIFGANHLAVPVEIFLPRHAEFVRLTLSCVVKIPEFRNASPVVEEIFESENAVGVPGGSPARIAETEA